MTFTPPAFSGWAILMRFGQKAHLEEFRQGILFTRPLQHFARIEKHDLQRYDRFEGSEQIVQPKDIKQFTIRDNATGREIVTTSADFAGPIIISTGKQTNCNVFCMFSVTQPVPKNFVDSRNYAFGDSFIIVTNTQEFLNRIATAADRLGLSSQYGLVGYYDEQSYTGETGPFSKPSAFAHQREFRIVIRPGAIDTFRLNIGSLEDITTPVHPLPEINDMCDFGPEPAQRAGLKW
jgi:hypothetical protein